MAEPGYNQRSGHRRVQTLGKEDQSRMRAASSPSGTVLCFMMVMTAFASGRCSSTFLTERGPVTTNECKWHHPVGLTYFFLGLVTVTHTAAQRRFFLNLTCGRQGHSSTGLRSAGSIPPIPHLRLPQRLVGRKRGQQSLIHLLKERPSYLSTPLKSLCRSGNKRSRPDSRVRALCTIFWTSQEL